MSNWSYRYSCDHCDRIVLCRVAGYLGAEKERVWCPECAPDCLERTGYRRHEYSAQIETDGALFVFLELAEMVPPKRYMPELLKIYRGVGYQVPYLILEILINKGLVTSTGAKLTPRAKKFFE